MTGGAVTEALSAVMADVQSVAKKDRNQAQGFNFRGIDAVINAVGPALRKHGVVVVPVDATPTFETYTTNKGAQMRNCTLVVKWRFYGPNGDSIEATTVGEAADAGDKAVAKAHSVAYRILFLQALCIPTDEPDPDASSHERQAPDARTELRTQIWQRQKARGMDATAIADDFAAWSQGERIGDADADTLTRYLREAAS